MLGGSSYVDCVRGQRLYVRGFKFCGRGSGAAAGGPSSYFHFPEHLLM